MKKQKKLKLCYECPLVMECDTRCLEAVAEEQLDTSDNYMASHEKYKPKGVPFLSYAESRRNLAKVMHSWGVFKGDD